MFGAGKVHPYNVADLTPAGFFDGGVNQQINGLSPGHDCLVKAWIKWEFRGHPPTGLKFYLGVDQTGQTTDGNAATIDWGDDQVASKAPVHEIFSHAWRTFTADSGRVSLWLRASQATSDPSFMFYVDGVEVLQISAPTAPAIALSTYHLDPIAPVGDSPPATSFTIHNSGIDTLNYSISPEVPWITVDPASGTCTDELDPISVTYNTASFAPGTYTGNINVTAPGASNTPQAISVTLIIQPPVHVNADFDFDGDVDQVDFGHIQACISGMGIPQTNTPCLDARLDVDDDVDSKDIAAFQQCLRGPGTQADPACEG